MFWISLIILTIFKLFLSGKDASSYLLREKIGAYEGLTKDRIDRWHRDGAIIDLMFTGAIAWATTLYITIPILSLLIRLSVYDISFNKYTSLPLTYLGSTSIVDRMFSKIFGINGAVKKSLTFAAIIVIWGLIKTFV